MIFFCYVRNTLDSLSSRRERQTQSLIAAKERYEKVSRDRQLLMEEVQRIEHELKKALKKKKNTLLEKMWVAYASKTKYAPFSPANDLTLWPL